jgi:hypothetical protein
MVMRATLKFILICASVALSLSGCAYLTPPPELEYYVESEPVLPEGGVYYIDPIDSAVVWAQEGIQIKVTFYNDRMLNEQYDPTYSPYTLGDWMHPDLDYTPPLWTVFDVTVINRTKDRVELDPTQVVLRLDDGRFFYCRQGLGAWWDKEHYRDYSYLRLSGLDGISEYHATFDRNDIWQTSQFQREKPVRKGSTYSGKLTFPALPADAKHMTLEINNFILAFDKFEVGFGNPTEFTNLVFRFDVDQGVKVVGNE